MATELINEQKKMSHNEFYKLINPMVLDLTALFKQLEEDTLKELYRAKNVRPEDLIKQIGEII